MFVRKKKVGAYEHYQLVENSRANGSVRQKVVAHLGRYRSRGEAARGIEKKVAEYREEARKQYRDAQQKRRRIARLHEERVEDGGAVRRTGRAGAPRDEAGLVREYWASRDQAEELDRRADALEDWLKTLRNPPA